MHPLLARPASAWYLLLWLLVGVLLAALLAGQGLPRGVALAGAVPLAAAFSFVCLSAWYVARSLPLRGTGVLRIGITALTAAALSSAMWLLMAYAWMGVVVPRLAPGLEPMPPGADAVVFGFGVLLYLLSMAVSYLIAASEASRESERRGLETEVLARDAELRALRAQVDPHFLFNSLHSISALTAADPPGARRMCLLLGDFLRESLALGGERRITLARELALVEQFLEIERVRFGPRLQTDIRPGNAGDCLVPPLLLQPIVENAVTHGIAHHLVGGVLRVVARREGGQLRIAVENPCDPDRPSRRGAGVGLSNVRARLRTLHGSDATLLAHEQDGIWRVEVTMPASSPENHVNSQLPTPNHQATNSQPPTPNHQLPTPNSQLPE
jgi:two-component system, LytTR family, sensor histidine kinase AlgZ